MFILIKIDEEKFLKFLQFSFYYFISNYCTDHRTTFVDMGHLKCYFDIVELFHLTHCLEGLIEYKVGDQEFQLHPGDNLHFKTSETHYCHNPVSYPAIFLLVFQTDYSQTIPHRISQNTEKFNI